MSKRLVKKSTKGIDADSANAEKKWKPSSSSITAGDDKSRLTYRDSLNKTVMVVHFLAFW